MWPALKARLWTFIPLVALYLTILGIINVRAGLQPAWIGMPAHGTVIAVSRCQHDDGTPNGTVKLTVMFRDQHNLTHTYRETACSPYHFAVGRSIALRYLAHDPSQVATQNDLDHLPGSILLLVFLILLAALCGGIFLSAGIYYLFIADRPGPAPRFITWIMLPAIGLASAGGVGVALCAVLWLNAAVAPDWQLASATGAGTATAQVIRVLGCEVSTGDAIIGLLPHTPVHTAKSHATRPPVATQNDGEQPVISFVDHAGLTQQLELNECDPSYHVGQHLDITYLLTDPTHLTFDGATDGPGIIGVVPGIVYCGEALVALVVLGALLRAAFRGLATLSERRQEAAIARQIQRQRARRAAANR